MLSCRQARRLLSQSRDTRLPLGQRLSLRLHLSMCKYCRNFGKQLQWLGAAAEALGDIDDHDREPDSQLSQEARQRLEQALHEASRDKSD